MSGFQGGIGLNIVRELSLQYAGRIGDFYQSGISKPGKSDTLLVQFDEKEDKKDAKDC